MDTAKTQVLSRKMKDVENEICLKEVDVFRGKYLAVKLCAFCFQPQYKKGWQAEGVLG